MAVNTFTKVVIGALTGFGLAILMINDVVTLDTVLAKCAVGQDMSLRQTTGQATLEVSFVDGVQTEIRCVSDGLETATN